MIIAVSPKLLLSLQFLLSEANHLSSLIFQEHFPVLVAIQLSLPLPYFLHKLQE